MMKIINLGGLGGCRITDTMIKSKNRKEAYPFDWNMTNQSFVINSIESQGNNFFVFEKKYVINEKYLISPNNDAFLCHDFDRNWDIICNEVKSKYFRRMDRLLNIINSDEKIYFCREMTEEIGYRDHPNQLDYVPSFKIESDSISLWENFIEFLNEKREIKINLILFTVNRTIETKMENIKIIYWNREVETISSIFHQINNVN